MSSGNMAIWEQVNDTPPQYTKSFTRGGGFRGTSVDPMYYIRRLTELFGPHGVGWRLDVAKEWSEEFGDSKYAFVKASIHYKLNKDSEQWHCTPYCIGGTDGSRTADEVYKASMTDAMSNCCKYLGFAEDIYTGKHDGDKYQTVPSKGASVPQAAPKPQPAPASVSEIADVFSDFGGDDSWEPEKYEAAAAQDAPIPGIDDAPAPSGNWRDVVIHFGKSKGMKLGDVDAGGRRYFGKTWYEKKQAEEYPLKGEDKTLYDAVTLMRRELAGK